jgi:hypothetical protein
MRNGTPENIPLSDWQTIVQKLQRASPAPRTDLTGKADVRVSATCGNDQRRRLGGCGTCRRAASRAHQGTGRKQPRYFGTWYVDTQYPKGAACTTARYGLRSNQIRE